MDNEVKSKEKLDLTDNTCMTGNSQQVSANVLDNSRQSETSKTATIKSRTPSGTELSLDFNDIRGYFSPTNNKKRKRQELLAQEKKVRSSKPEKSTERGN